MEPIKIILSSNRGSYIGDSIISSEFETLQADLNLGEGVEEFESNDLDHLNQFIKDNSGKYLLGFLGYGIGYQLVETLNSKNPPLSDLPGGWMIAVDKNMVKINQSKGVGNHSSETIPIHLKQLVSRESYFTRVSALKEHIRLGDIYEVNYCIPFVAENIQLDPETIWQRLQNISPMPFSAFIDHPDFSIISASPERFIKKQNEKIFIQPMKGTMARGKDEQEDILFYNTLKNDKKEQAENVMIVDLTRNDLSKIAKKGSVTVNELFGVQTFKSVHQMVSTVSCELLSGIDFAEIMRATFPMGSMTGAPKKRAMQLIEEYEDFSRGPFSGMQGYINPEGNFDFSVMIRTIFYSKKQKKLFVAVGSAITSGSDVEKEYEECLIKLQPLLLALNATII
jgi:para-aminobenzoate synthetase component 1